MYTYIIKAFADLWPKAGRWPLSNCFTTLDPSKGLLLALKISIMPTRHLIQTHAETRFVLWVYELYMH